EPHPRAVAAHRRAHRGERGAGHGVARTAGGYRLGPRDRRRRAPRAAARRPQTDDGRRVPARLRAPVSATPARRAAFSVLRRVFEDDSYADRALAAVVDGLDPRERAFAQQLAYGAVQR